MYSLLLSLSLSLPAHAGNPEPAPKMVKLLRKTYDCAKDELVLEYIMAETISGFTVTGWKLSGCVDPMTQAVNDRRGFYSLGPSDVSLRRRAPFDLSCDAAKLEYTYLDSLTRGVTGCEHRVTYVYVDHKWVANITND